MCFPLLNIDGTISVFNICLMKPQLIASKGFTRLTIYHSWCAYECTNCSLLIGHGSAVGYSHHGQVQGLLDYSLNEKNRNFLETVELQIGLVNYDPQRDKRFSGSEGE